MEGGGAGLGEGLGALALSGDPSEASKSLPSFEVGRVSAIEGVFSGNSRFSLGVWNEATASAAFRVLRVRVLDVDCRLCVEGLCIVCLCVVVDSFAFPFDAFCSAQSSI